MFDITYLGQRCFRFIKRYPRTWTIAVGSSANPWRIGIRVGTKSSPWLRSNTVTDYCPLLSVDRPSGADVTKPVAQGITHRQILDKGVLTNVLVVVTRCR